MLQHEDHWYLDHLYIEPEFQGKGIGSHILEQIKIDVQQANKPLRLGALRESKSNDFYLNHGFKQTHEGEFDIYYEYRNR